MAFEVGNPGTNGAIGNETDESADTIGTVLVWAGHFQC